MIGSIDDLFYLEEEISEEPEYPIVEWNNIVIRLLNKHHSLWGDKLAECAKICSDIIMNEKYNIIVKNKTIIELGAGAGLPSICCCIKNAKNVVCTDYPDENLVNNIRFNLKDYKNNYVTGYKWGDPVDKCIRYNNNEKFDIIILSDVIFNSNQHKQLLLSIKNLIKDDGYALVLHTHHRTNKVKEEMNFFELANDIFHIEKIAEVKHEPMFLNDISNTEEQMRLRTTAHVHILKLKRNN